VPRTEQHLDGDMRRTAGWLSSRSGSEGHRHPVSLATLSAQQMSERLPPPPTGSIPPGPSVRVMEHAVLTAIVPGVSDGCEAADDEQDDR
jgi:hypothetical protein